MTIIVQSSNTDHDISICGAFDAALAFEAKSAFQLVIDAGGNVRLDMSKTDFIDSSGIGAIVFLYKRLVMQSRTLELHGVNGQPRDLIAMLRLDRAIPTNPLAA
ncbi:STAS domain-containing protein [Nisaea sp.]|uniref:STAS domain-containing protein n=1 Tax=Nisaea sp. TaxID=2024842 RepID=UPI002B26C384|nr:STAS domain-containing protein [Nisaea sp.]